MINFNELSRAFIIAEIGVNHQGDMEVARDLITKAAQCGADAVKFQTYTPEHYVSTIQRKRFERIKRFCLGRNDFIELAKWAKKKGIIFFSTPLHMIDVDFLDDIVPLFKVSSGDLTFIELIQRVAKTGKPLIISTGAGNELEIRRAVNAVLDINPKAAETGLLMLMHCVCAYPVPPEEANLKNILWLQQTFDLPTGYSDHTLGTKACELAVASGAVAIEKHFTYRKEDQEFHDHALSADPIDLEILIKSIRTAEIYLGSSNRHRTPSEEKILPLMRRSLAASIDILPNTPLKKEWLTYVRPAWGVPPSQMKTVIGKQLKRKILAGDLLMKDDLL